MKRDWTARAVEAEAEVELASRFDRAWYVATYADVDLRTVDPLRHYLDRGWREGRDPNPHFSTRFYLETNPEIVGRGINPLVHYVLQGARAGRSPSPR